MTVETLSGGGDAQMTEDGAGAGAAVSTADGFDRIEDAIEDIRAGRMVIVVDDADRENEGDFVMAAEKVTPDAINFMATHGRGIICMPCTPERLDELRIPLMVASREVSHATAF